MKPGEIIDELKRLNVPHDVIGGVIGRDRTAATKMLGGDRGMKSSEVEPLSALVHEYRLKGAHFAAAPEDASALVRVPVYDARLSAGPGALNEHVAEVEVWEFSRRYLTEELKVSPTDLSVVEVQGDSMEPTLRSGDRVLVDHTDLNPAKPGVFAIWDSNATVVKRLEQIPGSDPAVLVLISDNKHHRRYTVRAEAVRVLGRVVWFSRRL